MRTRREFLKMTGLALGGVVLTSCGGSGGSSGRPVPNGFTYHRLINAGDPLPGGTTIADFPGSAMISSVDTVFFHATDSAGAMGCYELSVDYGGPSPTVAGIRKVVRDGDVLTGGDTVAKVSAGDINGAGSYASVLRLNSGSDAALYLDTTGNRMQRVLGYKDASPGVDGFIAQAMGDVDLHDNNDILLSTHFGNGEQEQPQAGLFHLPGGVAGSGSALVASSGDLVPNADGIVKSFGLVDRNDGGNYVTQAIVQLTSVPAGGVSAASRQPVRATALLAGNVYQAAPRKLLAMSPAMKASAALPPVEGEVILGPRLGVTANIAYVVHTTDDDMTLMYENRPVLSSGESSPRGDVIWSISPAVVGDNGLVYFSLVTETGVELCIYNGSRAVTILGSGDIFPYDDYNTMQRFIFGAMNTQVDDRGRITFIGDYANNLRAVVVGLPV
jgi:hypothetical protein